MSSALGGGRSSKIVTKCDKGEGVKPKSDVSGETLVPQTANTSAEARLDISARGVWAYGQREFLGVRVFNLFAWGYCGLTLSNQIRSCSNL